MSNTTTTQTAATPAVQLRVRLADLQRFTLAPEDARQPSEQAFTSPWKQGDWVFASNLVTVIRVPAWHVPEVKRVGQVGGLAAFAWPTGPSDGRTPRLYWPDCDSLGGRWHWQALPAVGPVAHDTCPVCRGACCVKPCACGGGSGAESCVGCRGTGWLPERGKPVVRLTCKRCNATGSVEVHDAVELEPAAGVEAFAARGSAGRRVWLAGRQVRLLRTLPGALIRFPDEPVCGACPVSFAGVGAGFVLPLDTKG